MGLPPKMAVLATALTLTFGCAAPPPASEVVQDEAEEDLACDEVTVRPTVNPGWTRQDSEAYVAGGCGKLAFYTCTRVTVWFSPRWSCVKTSSS